LEFREFLKTWLPVALWMALIFFDSTDLLSTEHTSRFLTPFLLWLNPDISPTAIAQAHLLLRKAAHVTEYAVFSGLFFRALRGLIEGFWWRAATALVPALLFAPADEFHQAFVPSRSSSPADVLIDYGGAILGISICWVIHYFAQLRGESTA
jgi:VanZ family protein